MGPALHDFQLIATVAADAGFLSLPPGSFFPGLEAKRIAHTDKVIHRGARQSYPDVEIELLIRTQLVSRPKVQQMSGPAALREIARIFGECVPGPCELAVEQERRFPRQVADAGLRRPVQRQHSGRRPVFGKLLRPRHLQTRIVPVRGFGIRPAWEAKGQNHGGVEPTLRMSNLLLYPQGQVAEPGSKRCEIVVRNGESQLGGIGQTKHQ